MDNTTLVRDPVCGMDVDPTTAAAHSEFKGQTYHFCSAGCKRKFDLHPDTYVGDSAGTSKGRGSCCS